MRGPRLPAGVDPAQSRPPCDAPRPPHPRGHSVSGISGSLGARGAAGKRPARAAPSGRARVRVLSGDGGEGVSAGKAGAHVWREVRGRGAGCRAEGAAGAGLSPGSGGRKGSHPSRRPASLPPGPADP